MSAEDHGRDCGWECRGVHGGFREKHIRQHRGEHTGVQKGA